MGAAPHLLATSTAASSQNILRRTVFVRQGRFFLTIVSVRVTQHRQQQHGLPRTYTAGRFTVREELVPCQQEQAGQTGAARLQGHCPVLHAALERWKEALMQQQEDEDQKKEQQQQAIQRVNCADTTQQAGGEDNSAAEHQQLQTQQRSWLRGLLSRRRQSGVVSGAAGPASTTAQESRVQVGCLQLGLGLGARLCMTLRSLVQAVCRAVFCRAAPGSVAAAGQSPAVHLPACGQGTAAELLGLAALAAHPWQQPSFKVAANARQGSVQIEVLCGLPTSEMAV